MYPCILRNVVPIAALQAVRAMIEEELENLRRDYCRSWTRDEFMRARIFPDSDFLYRLQGRCFYRGVVGLLVTESLISALRAHLDEPVFFCMPFLRYAFPGMTSNGVERLDDVLNSPLHYDDYGKDTRSTWIPLHDAGASTGSICFTENARLIEISGRGLSPEAMHVKGFPAEYIDLLRTEVREVHCGAGDAVIFDKTRLHGATYPRTAPRVSIDLRWISARDEPGQPIEKTMRSFSTQQLLHYKDWAFMRRHPRIAISGVKAAIRSVTANRAR